MQINMLPKDVLEKCDDLFRRHLMRNEPKFLAGGVENTKKYTGYTEGNYFLHCWGSRDIEECIKVFNELSDGDCNSVKLVKVLKDYLKQEAVK